MHAMNNWHSPTEQNSIWDDKVNGLTKCCSCPQSSVYHPLKLLGHFQSTYEADFWYASLFCLNYMKHEEQNKGQLKHGKSSRIYLPKHFCAMRDFRHFLKQNTPDCYTIMLISVSNKEKNLPVLLASNCFRLLTDTI
jgi:hypothetical protein